MRWTGLLVVLVACGAKSTPPAGELSNRGAGDGTPAPAPAGCPFNIVVMDAQVGDRALGATVVLSGGITEQVEITNERGELTIASADPNHRLLTVYYNDQTREQKLPAGPCGQRLRVEI
jgi:hypothetical protein